MSVPPHSSSEGYELSSAILVQCLQQASASLCIFGGAVYGRIIGAVLLSGFSCGTHVLTAITLPCKNAVYCDEYCQRIDGACTSTCACADWFDHYFAQCPFLAMTEYRFCSSFHSRKASRSSDRDHEASFFFGGGRGERKTSGRTNRTYYLYSHTGANLE